jgi:hypothetical protein
LDIDICGPSIPKVMGLDGEQVSVLLSIFIYPLYNKFLLYCTGSLHVIEPIGKLTF